MVYILKNHNKKTSVTNIHGRQMLPILQPSTGEVHFHDPCGVKRLSSETARPDVTDGSAICDTVRFSASGWTFQFRQSCAHSEQDCFNSLHIK